MTRRPAARARAATTALGCVLCGVLALPACSEVTSSPDQPTSLATTPTESSTTRGHQQPPSSTGATAVSGCFADVREAQVPAVLNNLAFPDRTVVYDVDEHGDNGIVLTGVTDTAFRASAAQMRARYTDPPFEVVGYDTAESALGANWSGPSISGRWVVSDISATCRGDTEVKILWTSQG